MPASLRAMKRAAAILSLPNLSEWSSPGGHPALLVVLAHCSLHIRVIFRPSVRRRACWTFSAMKVRGSFIEASVMCGESWGARLLRSGFAGKVLDGVADGFGELTRCAEHGALGLNNLGNPLGTQVDCLAVNSSRHGSDFTFQDTKTNRPPYLVTCPLPDWAETPVGRL